MKKFLEKPTIAVGAAWVFFTLCACADLHWAVVRTVETSWWTRHYGSFLARHTWLSLTAGEWSAWVHAIGSIAAIAGAYHIGGRQLRQIKRERLASILAICGAAINRVELIEKIFCTTPEAYERRYHDFDISQVNSVITALTAIPYHELGSPIAVVATLELLDQMRFIAIAIEAFDVPVDYYGVVDHMQQAAIRATNRSARSSNILTHVHAAKARFDILQATLSHE